nr:elongation factor-like protein (EFL) [Polytomella parva]
MKAYEALLADDPRDHYNIVFIGHIDAGKSTLAGQILFLTGGVDKRTIEKYEREAKEKNREGWYMAYIMDTNEEERVKGITVEVGRAHFETEKKRYTVLDAPGHKNYVPNMIQGACQADVAILVISARKGEFETGFERGGQTREHAQLAKTLGVSKLIVAVNKLDCPSVCLPGGKWDKARFDQIVTGLTPFLRSCGYNIKKEVTFLPLAALYGHNIKDVVAKDNCEWYDGNSLFEILDGMEPVERNPLAPFRMPIVDKWKDMGTVIMGKSENGFVRVGDVLQIMPNKLRVKVEGVYRDEKETNAALSGENLRLRISGAEETDISPGFVLSSIKNPVPVVMQFEAQLVIVELLEHNPIFTVGYKSILHIHTAVEECEVTKLVSEIDPKTKEQKRAKYIKSGGICVCRISIEKSVCMETFAELSALGRFTLRDEGRTIAIGKVMKLPKIH